jgi:signal transduction histidine kinase
MQEALKIENGKLQMTDLTKSDGNRVRIITSVRFRLTIWYLLVFGSLLVLFCSFIYAALARELQARVDRSLGDSISTVASVLASEVDENRGDIRTGASEALEEIKLPNTFISVIVDGKVIAADAPELEDVSIPVDAVSRAAGAPGQPVMTTVKVLGPDGARIAVLDIDVGGKVCTLAAAHPLGDVASQLGLIRRMFYLALPGALIIAGLGGFLMARKSLAPVVAMSGQAERIGASNLHERFPVRNRRDELGRLALVFNELLSRLDGSFKGMRQFMADASHELRTPLSIVRGEADIALSQERSAAEYRAALEIIQDEAARLSSIVEDMLELARADAGQRPLNRSRFYVNDVVEECCRSMHVLSAAKGVSLKMNPASDVSIVGDEDLVRRMLLSLLDNAIKYTAAGGSVSVRISQRQAPDGSAGSEGGEPELRGRQTSGMPLGEAGGGASGPDKLERPAIVEIEISDTGIGVPVEAASQVFNRFYRGAQARAEHPRGTGLGLAIARWIAESHGGSIRVTSGNEAGSTFTITLPAQSNRFE